jgi:transcription-repair coupling factor (superfamily II helicase)
LRRFAGKYVPTEEALMRGLIQLLQRDDEATSALADSEKIIAPTPTYPFLLAIRAMSKPLLVITGSSKAAEDLSDELKSLHSEVFEFPAWETLPHERLSPRSDTVAKRLATLYALKAPTGNPIVVAPIRAVID